MAAGANTIERLPNMEHVIPFTRRSKIVLSRTLKMPPGQRSFTVHAYSAHVLPINYVAKGLLKRTVPGFGLCVNLFLLLNSYLHFLLFCFVVIIIGFWSTSFVFASLVYVIAE